MKQISLVLLPLASFAGAQPAPPAPTTLAPAVVASVLVPQGTPLTLVTLTELSSRRAQKGVQFPLKVHVDVLIDGLRVIPAGTEAVGVISDARDTGGLGVNGKLQVAPLYLTIGGETVRLTGGAVHDGKTKGDAVVGMLFTELISGRKAVIPAGTLLGGRVMRDIRLPVVRD